MKKRVTVSLDPVVDAAARQAVADGRAPNVSAYVESLIVRQADAEVARAKLDELFGPATPEADRWAREALGVSDTATA